MMKKRFLISIFTILVAVSFIAGLAACGDSEKSVPTASVTEPDITEKAPSTGLSYIEKDGTYTVSGIGTCEDEDLVIPSEYEGLPVTAVDDGAFYYAKSFTRILIPDSVTYIGDDAFYYCTYLTDVIIEGESVSYIGNRAFYYCKTLESVNIPDSVAYIGDSAFENCQSLLSFTVPENLTSLGNRAFYGCTAVESIRFDAPAAEGFSSDSEVFYMLGQEGRGVDVTFAANVTDVPAYLFYPCDSESKPRIKSVDFEEGSLCERLNNYAFYDCTYLTAVTIPENVTYVGRDVFYNCTALESINYRMVTTDIKFSSIFSSPGTSGNGLTITMGKEIAETYTSEFSGCMAITKVVFEDGSLCSNIAESAFYSCTALTSVNIPEGVTSIGKQAFYNCSALKSINIPAAVATVDTDAFSGCTALTAVYADDLSAWCSIEFVNADANPLATAKTLYVENRCVTDMTIPEDVTTICDYAFYNCTSLTSVSLGSGVESFGTDAFYMCSSLKSVYITDLTAWCLIEFADGYSNPVNYGGVLYLDGSPISDLVIPQTITEILPYTFYRIETTLKSVTLHDNVVSVGDYAFYDCCDLTDLSLNEGLVSIGAGAFCFCTALKGVTIPESVAHMGNYAFYACYQIDSIRYNVKDIEDVTSSSNIFAYVGNNATDVVLTIGANVTKIPDYLFKGYGNYANASGITKVVFEEGSKCTYIGNYAFEYCVKLTEITIPDSVTYLGEGVFYYCKALMDVIYPDSFTATSDYMFYGCSSLTDLPITENITTIGKYTFGECTALTDIVIPDYVVSVMDYAFYQCTSLESMVLGEGVTAIESYTFNKCTSLASINLSDRLTSIGAYAFYGCSSLTSITVPENLKTIGDDAFYNCTKAKYIYFNAVEMDDPSHYGTFFRYAGKNVGGGTVIIGKDVTKIPDYIFEWCNSIKYVVFEEDSQCTSIGYRAFYQCQDLISVTIPESVTKIGEQAFYECTLLEEIYYNAVTITSSISSKNQIFCDAGTDGSGITLIIGENVTEIPAYLFIGYYYNTKYRPNITAVYYCGTEEEWTSNLSIASSNDAVTNAERYYYSEDEPSDDGKYWHYDENGNPVTW